MSLPSSAEETSKSEKNDSMSWFALMEEFLKAEILDLNTESLWGSDFSRIAALSLTVVCRNLRACSCGLTLISEATDSFPPLDTCVNSDGLTFLAVVACGRGVVWLLLVSAVS